MLINLGLILILAIALKQTGKPAVYGGIYFLIHLIVGVANGNPFGSQIVMSAIFSVVPFLAFLLLHRFDGGFAWILIIIGAAFGNDMVGWGIRVLLEK